MHPDSANSALLTLTCILGMHRSGTSYLAGALAAAGLYLGETGRQGSPANARGNHENRAIVIFHENILRSQGFSWDKPPDTIAWEDRHRERALELARAYPAGRPCGFKDPRTLLHLGHWQSLPLELVPVGIFRHPLACARSLQSRDGMPLEQGLRLWTHYNRRLLQAWQKDPFPLLDFDWPEQELHEALLRTIRWLGLPAGNPVHFFDASLRHNRKDGDPAAAGPALPEETLRLYLALDKAAQGFWSTEANI